MVTYGAIKETIMGKMRILGIEGNVGSLLYPFQEAGHEIVGNYDSRGIINEENFGINFPESELYGSMDEMYDHLEDMDIDVVVAQPSCSKFSQLSRKSIDDYEEACVDLAASISAIQPKYFFIESKLDYIHEVPIVQGYKYQLEWVSNYHYGNTQKTRNRLWVIGVRDDIDWKFLPGEKQHTNTVASVIENLGAEDIPFLDHVHIYKPFLKDSIKGLYLTLDEAHDMLKRDGKLSYLAADGETKNRINRKMANPLTSTTITGGGTWFHWDKKYPFTLREKARVQGFPDEFSFKGLSATKKDKAVGKSMPFEFTRFLVSQLDNPKLYPTPFKVVPEPAKLSMFKKTKFKQYLA